MTISYIASKIIKANGDQRLLSILFLKLELVLKEGLTSKNCATESQIGELSNLKDLSVVYDGSFLKISEFLEHQED